MRILLTGAGGDLASAVFEIGAKLGHEWYPRHHTSLDVSDATAVQRTLANVRPDVVINCANRLYHEGDSAIEFARVNYLGVAVLADMTRLNGCALIQPVRPGRSYGGIVGGAHVFCCYVANRAPDPRIKRTIEDDARRVIAQLPRAEEFLRG